MASRWQGALVAAEVALAFVLAASAGLLLQSFAAIRKADIGFADAAPAGMPASPPADAQMLARARAYRSATPPAS